MNVFVPSKGRSSSSKLLNLAYQQNEKIIVVVEPQEQAAYKSAFPKFEILVLPENNKGITYVRNFIKNYTESQGVPVYWQLDDDISSLYYREGTKMIKTGLNVLGEAQQQFAANGISLGALEYQQFAWSATKEMVSNSFCDTCVYVENTSTHGMRYREYVEGKEDRDFAMQVIKAGLKTGRTTLYAFASPPNGSNAGGLKEIFYDAGREQECVKRMVELWGERICVPIVKKTGRNDVKIMWNEINNSQTHLF